MSVFSAEDKSDLLCELQKFLSNNTISDFLEVVAYAIKEKEDGYLDKIKEKEEEKPEDCIKTLCYCKDCVNCITSASIGNNGKITNYYCTKTNKDTYEYNSCEFCDNWGD